MIVPNDIEIIKRLEKQIGKKLKKLKFNDIWLNRGYAIDKKGNVTGLNLDGLKLTDISPLKELNTLTYLDLNGNQLTDISPLKELNTLKELYLSGTQLTDISPLKELNRLTDLRLDNNQLTDISPLKELNTLTVLRLNDNQLTDISPLKELNTLTVLLLDNNQLTDISPLKELNTLTRLDLDNNQLTDISPLKELNTLTHLNLSNNKITYLPRDIAEWNMEIKWENDYRSGIYLKGNPLESPPVEIVKQGTEAVKNYFKDLEEDSVRLLQSKLLIVGSGEVGKTTLMKKLKDNNFKVEIGKEETTHGINIVPWELQCQFDKNDAGKVNVHFWDFGGQEIYHATHQFFLTKRSLYLFVWEARKEEESKSFDYWLNIIKLLSGNCPVIVVMNKSDVRLKHIDEAVFKEKFNNIVDFLRVSCVSGDGIPGLTDHIRMTLGCMDHLKDKLPGVWMKIRDHLKAMKINYISLSEFFEICRKYNLNETRAEYLSDYLHDLGVILHYRRDKLLQNTVILNPEWATEAVYSLVDTREIMENRGRFQFHDLKKYWDLKKYPRDKHAELVRLMEKFELCFPIPGTDIHIVPELLPTKRPGINFDEYKKENNLHFQYHYDFMPEGIITRFISRMYYLIKEDHFWKNGVELAFEDSSALVLSESLNRKIKISVGGSCKSELLAIIKNDFAHIHQTLNMDKNKHYDEMIPCICSKCIHAAKPHFYKYDALIMFKQKNAPNICPESAEGVPVEKLLKGIEPPEPTKNLLKTLITAASQLQGISRAIKDENIRSTFFVQLLHAYGFYVKDQTLWGSSAAGKSMGHVDFKIENQDRETEAIVEAFNLEYLNRTVIDDHLKKLFGYDPNGLENNFIVVYSAARDFLGLWKKYLDHIPGIDFKHRLVGEPQEQGTRFSGIKLARARHLRRGEETYVYHLFIDMNP